METRRLVLAAVLLLPSAAAHAHEHTVECFWSKALASDGMEALVGGSCAYYVGSVGSVSSTDDADREEAHRTFFVADLARFEGEGGDDVSRLRVYSGGIRHLLYSGNPAQLFVQVNVGWAQSTVAPFRTDGTRGPEVTRNGPAIGAMVAVERGLVRTRLGTVTARLGCSGVRTGRSLAPDTSYQCGPSVGLRWGGSEHR